MGCDIHFYVEKKVNGKWESADTWTETTVDNVNRLTVTYDDRFYTGRNYNLFGILAGVRNYDVTPISEPLGLPEDCDQRIKEESFAWGSDGHSHSYFLLSELLDYDWSETLSETLVVPEKEYLKWQEEDTVYPDSYYGMAWGADVEIIDEYEYDCLEKDPSKEYYIVCERDMSYKDSCSHFLNTTMPKLKELDSDPNNVRIVFWFDN